MNTPVLVGIGQVEQRISDPAAAKEPIQLMHDAVAAAAADAGIADLGGATSIRVVRGVWPYANPAAAIAQAIGAQAETCLTPYGGNFVQSAVNASVLDIQQGNHELIVMTGAECGNTQAKAAKAELELDWQSLPGKPDRIIGADVEMRHAAEKAIRVGRPIQIYPIFETALRHHLGLDVETHLQRISELWARFSAVAADNPHAWIRDAKSAEEIRTLSTANRPVSYPYPKFMNSNSNVDQGAALILCSTDRARALGIPQDKWVYPWSGTDAHDHYFVSNRDNLYSSPAIRLAGNRALELADVAAADLEYVDLYSCFPVAVQVAARELQLDITRPLTVTGGLTWAGGPLNNYVMHSIARMAQLLRATPGRKGLITANGGYLTKHAFGVYSTEPPAKPFQHEDMQTQVDALPRRDVVLDHSGTATVEGYSVMYAGEQPHKAFISTCLDDGRRAWGVTEDPGVMQDMISNEYCGREVRLAGHTASF